MPSIKNITLAAAGLIGMATAFPQGGFQNSTYGNTTTGPVSTGNGTSPGTNGTSPSTGNNGTSTNDNSLFCPNLNAQVYITPTSASFIIECNTNHFGVVIDIEISLSKRQANRPTNLGDCLDLCAATDSCVGTGYNSVEQTCTLFSSVGAAYTDNDVSFGVRVADGAPSSVPAGATLTSTILSTNVVTIASCAPTVTDCPLNAGAVVTEVIAVASTTYICPSATVVPLAPVACGCAYGVSTAAAYQATVTLGSTILVPVTSTVIAVPSPSGTTYSTTTCPASTFPAAATNGAAANGAGANGAALCSGCPPAVTTAPVTTYAKGNPTTTSGLAVYTGAAGQVKAGMGMGAVVAAAALLL